MAAGWRTIRVFISSTFRDMQAERDHLVRFVFPRIRADLLKRRIHLVDVDLRWGVTSEQDALAVCREIIDECRPRFICMLGGRYGWTPPDKERSITADEVHYAALDEVEPRGYEFFYFRSPAATWAIPGDAAREGGYREFPTDEDIDEYGAQRAQGLAAERTRKLEALKQAVRDAGLPVVDYACRWDAQKLRLTGLEAFGEAVYRDLMASIDEELGAEPPPPADWFGEENAAMEAFIEERTERYVVGSRQALLDQMAAHAEGTGAPSVLVLTGEPGSGKSALLGRFCRDYAASHRADIMVTHFIGASRGSTDLRSMLRRLCHEVMRPVRTRLDSELHERLQALEDETSQHGAREQEHHDARAAINAQYAIPEDLRELPRALERLLQMATRWRRVVIVIDALNQLDATGNAHALNWLRWPVPEGVRIICSSLEHPALDALRRDNGQVREVTCGPLTADDSGAIMDAALARYHKRLDGSQRAAMLAKTEARLPLYLLSALEQLRTLGTYELITRRIEELPGTVAGLFDWILQRLEEGVEGQEEFGKALVSTYTAGIAIGRGGMTEGELEALCQPVDDEGEFWMLHRMLRPYLMPRGELIDYFHGQLREAVERRYLPDADTRRTQHKQVARLLHDRADPLRFGTWSGCPALAEDDRARIRLRAFAELPYHLAGAGQLDALGALLLDLCWLDGKLQAIDVPALVADFDYLDHARPAVAVGRAIRQAGHILRRDRGQLREQLLARLEPGKEAVLTALLHTARESNERAWLRPVRPSIPAPDALLHTLIGHKDLVTTVALTADGRAVSGGSCLDNTVRVWDLDSGSCIHCLSGHEDHIQALALAPDDRAVSASTDRTLRIWDLETGQCLHTLVGHEAKVDEVAISPDGRIVSRCDVWDHTIRVWDLDSGECLRILTGHKQAITAMALDAHGRIVSASLDGTLRVWSARTGRCLRTLGPRRGWFATLARWFRRSAEDDVDENEKRLKTMALTRDGRAATASDDLMLRVWDLRSGRCLHTLCGHEARINAVVATDDGRLVSASGESAKWGPDDNKLRVWDLTTGECLLTLSGHEGPIHAVALTADGEAVSASEDRTVRVWDLESGSCVAVLQGHESAVLAAAVTDDGRVVSASRDHTLRVWDLAAAREAYEESLRQQVLPFTLVQWTDDPMPVPTASEEGVRAFNERVEQQVRARRSHDKTVVSVAVSGRGHAISGSSDKTVCVWDLESGRCMHRFSHDTSVLAVVPSPDGRFVSAQANGTVEVYDLQRGQYLHASKGHYEPVQALAVTPDARLVVSGGGDFYGFGTSRAFDVRVWDLGTGQCLHTLSGHEHEIKAVAVTADGRAVSASEDRTLRVWDLASGECLHVFREHEYGVRDVAVTPDGRAVSASNDRTLRVWDLSSGRCLHVLSGHATSVCSVAPAADGRAVSASWDKTLRVWCLETGRCLHVLAGHEYYVDAVAVTPDGRAISGSHDRSIRVWDLETGRQTARFDCEGAVRCVAFDPARRCIVAGDSTGAVHLLDLVDGPADA